MPTVTALAVAATVPGSPRLSAAVSYNGRRDRSVFLQIVCPTWLSADPATEVAVAIEVSYDSGATWNNFCAMTTHPPDVGKSGALPALNCSAGDDLGARQARAFLSVGQPLTIGLDATT